MKEKILIVDDEQGIRDAFSSALGAAGYTVETAASGEEGVEKVKQDQFDLIYLDLKMPGIGGVEALRVIHQLDSDIPIYIVTAFHAEYFSELESLRNEGVHFEILAKPLERKQIQEITDGIFGY